MSLFHPICGDCGFRVDQGTDSFCSITKLKVNKDLDSCSKHTPQESMRFCEICGNPFIEGGIIDLIDGSAHLICNNCASKLNTCQTCKEVTNCDFETNPSPIQKVIQQQVRQGNMVMMTTVKNPKRIEETCKKNCKCYDEKNECIRENIQFCTSWVAIYN